MTINAEAAPTDSRRISVGKGVPGPVVGLVVGVPVGEVEVVGIVVVVVGGR